MRQSRAFMNSMSSVMYVLIMVLYLYVGLRGESLTMMVMFGFLLLSCGFLYVMLAFDKMRERGVL